MVLVLIYGFGFEFEFEFHHKTTLILADLAHDAQYECLVQAKKSVWLERGFENTSIPHTPKCIWYVLQ